MPKPKKEVTKPKKPRAGFIAIVGKPNVGKSSIINAFVGEKVSIVTPKSQTTRDNAIGILTHAGDNPYQMIFIDTPGIHEPKSKLGNYMAHSVNTAAKDADVVLVVLDAMKGISEVQVKLIEGFLQKKSSVYVAVNKIDLAGYEKTYPFFHTVIKYSEVLLN